MKFYRYFKNYGFEALRDKKLFASKVSDFNDPFELAYRLSGEITYKKAKRFMESRFNKRDFYEHTKLLYPNKVKNERDYKIYIRRNKKLLIDNFFKNYRSLSEIDLREAACRNARCICFTAFDVEPMDEILLWSHYADSHKGIRIGIEFSIEENPVYLMKKIDYQSERIQLDLTEGIESKIAQDSLKKLTSTKSNAWRYEKEYRLTAPCHKCEKIKDSKGNWIFFFPIPENSVLGVDFGLRCDEKEKSKITNLVRSEYPSVILRQAEYHKENFELFYKPIDLSPTN